MSSLESTLAADVQAQKVPQAVVYASNKDGSFTYQHATGGTSVGSDAKPIEQDAVFKLASSTKLVTSIAALQAVEQGLIGLDDDVAPFLPELAKQPVIEGFNGEEPILKERKNAITLRLLLTHSAGTVYDVFDPNLVKLRAQQGHATNSGATVLERFNHPLVFEPGIQWAYGTGVDWAGLLIERLSNTTLDAFMKKNIWAPLGITTMAFFPDQVPGLSARIPQTAVRTPEGKLAPYTDPDITSGVTGAFGGHGMHSSIPDYHKVQLSLLRNDGKLLSPASVNLMFTPQLDAARAKSLNDFLHTPMGAMFIGEFLPDIELNWGIGGLLFMRSDEGRRTEGTLNWGGMNNSFWTIDRKAGTALVFGTQLLPPGDLPTKRVITSVEKGVYKMAGAA